MIGWVLSSSPTPTREGLGAKFRMRKGLPGGGGKQGSNIMVSDGPLLAKKMPPEIVIYTRDSIQ